MMILALDQNRADVSYLVAPPKVVPNSVAELQWCLGSSMFVEFSWVWIASQNPSCIHAFAFTELGLPAPTILSLQLGVCHSTSQHLHLLIQR
jgi:hypothetical protein